MKKYLLIVLVFLILLCLCSCLSPAEKEKREQEKKKAEFIEELIGRYEEETYEDLPPRILTVFEDGSIKAEYEPFSDMKKHELEHYNFVGNYELEDWKKDTGYLYLRVYYYIDSGKKQEDKLFTIERTQAGEIYLREIVYKRYYYRVNDL